MKIPGLPFDFSGIREKLSSLFDFSRREIVITASVTALAIVTAAVITITVMSLRQGNGKTSEISSGSGFESENIAPADKRPFLSDFIIYENKLQESFTGPIYSHKPGEEWSDELIQRYWIDPEAIALEHLEQETDKVIKDIFADVP